MIVEICCDSYEKALAVRKAGGDRIELCGELAVGGVTPSPELVARVMKALPIPVHVMIRPRAGNFHYSPEETGRMLDSTCRVGEISKRSRSEGRKVEMDGVVFGVLDAAGNVDAETCRRLIRLARSLRLSVTFHRAIDVAKDPLQAFKDILPLGVDRVLSSGGTASAFEGRFVLARMQEISKAEQGPILMPGRGVTAANFEAIAQTTRAREIHGSRLEIIGAARLAEAY